MELILMFLVVSILLVLNAYLLQTLKDEVKNLKKEENKPKQYKREHSSISKTNFRKYIEWANRCICKI